MSTPSPAAIRFHDQQPAMADFHAEVVGGLRAQPKRIPPKFFYDEAGSRLFDGICAQPEYYQTRTETRILRDHAADIAGIVGHNCLLIEPGSGSCEKVRHLLDALRPTAYVPMDISGDYLRQTAEALSVDYPWLEVHAACIDFTRPIDLSFCPTDSHIVAFFPGSSIGNFEPEAAERFLRHVAATVGRGGGMLIGVDLKKDTALLNAAYNDAEGVTAAFNLNLLDRINRELGGDFDIDSFRHRAFYNAERGRIEMHLESTRAQSVTIRDEVFRFTAGESIHTENSYKYTVAEFAELAQRAGFQPVDVWTDADELFSVHYLTVSD